MTNLLGCSSKQELSFDTWNMSKSTIVLASFYWVCGTNLGVSFPPPNGIINQKWCHRQHWLSLYSELEENHDLGTVKKYTRPAMIIELLFCSFPLVDVSTSPSAFLHASCGSVSSRLRRLHAALKNTGWLTMPKINNWLSWWSNLLFLFWEQT